ncbi:MAG: histidine--tRNA ligase [Nitrospira sp.]|nr:histidine--tRNA ligase [Nitrospira sp.]MBP0122068.1 histidine--tRNA ligase [Nitrospira sp.]MBP0123875.1 histidine--tRNA ligase [Nitrospira sp.]MBP0127411.1 histidine--tRNA ligase [Nitrospira sp.]MBP0129749.1 histidine--tRNA ligase [Nitrospira sp.]
MIKGIKGIKDILPEETPRWRFIEDTARRWALCYGYQEIRIPIFELTALFARSIGAATDIVEKEMYTFPDRDGTSLTLRPEGTAGTVRAFIEHNRAAEPLPQKYFYIGPMFRHERPQAGRLRQFHQFGVESLGTSDPRVDVEAIALLWRLLSDLGLPDLTLEINSLGSVGDRAAYKPILLTFLAQQEASLCANCRRRMETNPLRVLDCKMPECRTATESAPKLTDHLAPEARAHFDQVLAGLQAIGVPYKLNPRLVRGLDYYCLTSFEITSTHLGAQNAVGAGGRYDGLVETLGGPSVPAIGFAVGLERVSLMLPETMSSSLHECIYYVAAFGENGTKLGLVLLDELRRLGLSAQCDYRAVTLKAHLRQADRSKCRYAIILGDDEAGRGAVILRNLESKAQEEIPLGGLAFFLKSRTIPS